MTNLSIALIYPELLGTYGDQGNARVLSYRCKKRNIENEIVRINAGDKIPTSCDIYLLGGGEDSAQTLATKLLSEQKSNLNKIVKTSYLLSICAGFQILGKQFPSTNGKLEAGLDLIDVTTKPGSPRIIGEVKTNCNIKNLGKLTGFENHGGRTILGSQETALGKVYEGQGNGISINETFVDGYLSEHIFCTYLHGPLLARNPLFADYLISKAIGVEMTSLAEIENDSSVILHDERLKA